MRPEDYLRSILPAREEVDRFLARSGADGLQPNRGWTYDPVLGWVHANAVHRGDGTHGTDTFYTYEDDGARRVLHFADRPCRIHTYGNSFTHGDQVNDGETWQSALSAHLGEPIRNYGVGGYSVYQAYRRMLHVEGQGRHRAQFLLLNIYDDDHYRNLDSWRRLRFGRRSVCGYTLPHLRVHVERQSCQERDNLLQTIEEVYRLCDLDWVVQTFRDDPILAMVLASKAAPADIPARLEPVAVSFGLPPDRVGSDEAGAALRRLHTEAAFFATRRVLEMTEQFASRTGKKLMVLLSFGRENMRRALSGEPRFDQPLLDWLRSRPYPVLDLRNAFAEDYRMSRLSLETYLDHYYNGHHTPAGNFFTAWTIRDSVAHWLSPPPPCQGTPS